MIFLAIDTSENFCAVCLYDSLDKKEKARKVLNIEKGHSEYLIDLIQDVVRIAQIDYPSIGALAVSIGPGSFTGIRVGVSVVRGLSLALGIPALGISVFEALAETIRTQRVDQSVLVLLDTPRKDKKAALFDEEGHLLYGPSTCTMKEIVALIKKHNPILTGSGCAFMQDVNMDCVVNMQTADIATYAQLAIKKWPFDGQHKPKPLYLSSPVGI